MNRTLANTTPIVLALLATLALTSAAQASAGGASAPSGPAAHRTQSQSRTPRGMQVATWFGPGFYGQKTACGQTMSPVIVGVASRTLPCGTLVAVSYKGHHLTIPVIDRGPYGHNGATWDLTWGAASALTIAETVRVKTKVVGSAPNTPLLGVPAEALQQMAAAAASGGTAAG